MKKLRKIFMRLFSNLSFLLHHDVVKELSMIKNAYVSLYNQDLLKGISSNNELSEAYDFIREAKYFHTFPYPSSKISENPECGVYEGYPYVVHKGKRLFFPHDTSLSTALSFYVDYIENERIINTEGDYPHQYQSGSFRIEKGDVLVDIGCAEALLSLDVVDLCSKIYIIECDTKWLEPLRMTFANYLDKVVIINKFISDNKSEDSVSLAEVLKDEVNSSLFIKMDIEGAEVNVLNGSRHFLSTCSKVKLACCTYHRRKDAEVIKSIIEQMGFSYSFSYGYMFTAMNDVVEIPSFRKGVIRAYKS